jgi:hypothetical protein
MHTHRFGKKLKLPSTIAIKHQIRKLMWKTWSRRQRSWQELKQCADRRAKKSFMSGKQKQCPRQTEISRFIANNPELAGIRTPARGNVGYELFCSDSGRTKA